MFYATVTGQMNDEKGLPDIPAPPDLTNISRKKRRTSNRRHTLLLSMEAPGISRSMSRDFDESETKSVWSNVDETMQQVDDFFCIKENSSLLPERIRKKRMSAVLIVPEKRVKDVKSQITEIPAASFDKFLNKGIALCDAQALLSDKMMVLREQLDMMLNQSAQQLDTMMDFGDKFAAKSFLERKASQKKAVKQLLFYKAMLKFDRCRVELIQTRIRAVAVFQDFLSQKQEVTHVDYPMFEKEFLLRESQKPALCRARAARLKAAYTMEQELPATPATREDRLRSPAEKSGRILQRFEKVLEEIEYSDCEVIMKALSSDSVDAEFARHVMFDIAWGRFMFPFADVDVMTFPDILHETPKILNPPYLSEPVLNTPFNEINGTDWPLRDTSLALFDLMIETDPFVIADLYWDWIQGLANSVQSLAIESGCDPDEAEIGFDVLFQYTLLCVFAFGVSEILEVMKFSASFLDYVGNDTHKQFAMTNCLAVVTYISRIGHQQ